MVFSSNLFIFFFLPIFLILYLLSPKNGKNYIILVASLLFYAWGAPKFVFLVAASLTLNFYIVFWLYNYQKHKKLLTLLSILINLGLLGYFKYANFFVENLNSILSQLGFNHIHWIKVALPIGISFFTFQSLTYTIDVYRNIHKPLSKLSDYLLYILMFPQLIAGPIVRFNTIADDIIDRSKNETFEIKLYGIYRFTIGLAKKIIIANTIGEQVDIIYSLPISEIDTVISWIAIIAYSFQIYFDFSGYSDMAIGLGKFMGFNFPENFNNPYISQNITEFWRRWHITLGTWMRDYLYIPLGGNRVSSASRLYVNLMIVFLLSGLWHGASWNFVIWGVWHGLFLILDRLFLIKLFKPIGKITRIFINYIIVLIGWVFFRIENFDTAIDVLHKMFSFNFSNSLSFKPDFWATMILGGLFAFITISKIGLNLENMLFYKKLSKTEHIAFLTTSVILLIICTAFITASGFNPFIYFRF